MLSVTVAVLGVERAAGAADEVDARMPVRVGWSWAAAYRAPALAVGVSSQFEGHISPAVGIFLGTEVEGITVYDPRSPDRTRGFLGLGITAGIFLRTPTIGPALSLEVPFMLDVRDNDVVGAGLGLRATFYPYHHTLVQTLECERGPFGAYVASSVFVWSGLRLDTNDESQGLTVSFGAGIDVSRIALTPIIAWVFKQGCSKERRPDYEARMPR